MSHNLAGFSAPISNFNIAQVLGKTGVLPINTETFISPLGGAAPSFPSDTGELIRLVSADASDVGELRVVGLDTDYKVQTERVQLNGITPVNTTKEFTRINDLQWLESTAAAGNISATNVGATETFRLRTASAQLCEDLVYTTPAGSTAEANQIYGAVTQDLNSQTICNLQVYFRPIGEYFQRYFELPLSSRGASANSYLNVLSTSFEGPVDVYATATNSDADASAFCRLSLKIL